MSSSTKSNILRAYYDAYSKLYPDYSALTIKKLADVVLLRLTELIAEGYQPAAASSSADGALELVILSAIAKAPESLGDIAIAPKGPSKRSIIQIAVDGQWSIEDMRKFLTYVEEIYNYILTVELIKSLKERADIVFNSGSDRGRIALLTGSPWIIPKESYLEIHRIKYGSPGVVDLAGLGVVIGHLKDLLTKVLDLAATREQRKLENQERALKNQRLQIDNARGMIDLAKQIGCNKSEIRELALWITIRQDGLAKLASTGKIRSIRITPDDE